MMPSPADPKPPVGGGLPVLHYWIDQTLTPEGAKLWQVLNHQSACLSCAWGTGGQAGGFVNEAGERLQRCAKSVEAIAAELQAPIKADFFAQYPVTTLQQLTSQGCDRLGRLSYPVRLRAGGEYFERVTWAEVYDAAAAGLQGDPARIASYSSGRSSNEAAYVLQLMLRALGSNHLADCSDLCHAPSTVGLKQVFGSGTSMVSLEGLQQADCVVLVGSNAPANHPRLMNELIKLRDRGGKVIMINPQLEAGLVKFASPAFPIKSLLKGGSDIATLYLQPIPGSDTTLFVGLQKSLIEQDLIAWDYLRHYTDHWQAVIDQARATAWEEITAGCGVSVEEITAAAAMLGGCDRTVFAWAMGITQQANGVDNVHSIANTALLTGNAGRPGTGTMPIRGHSNVQGFGSMGVTANLRDDVRRALEEKLGKPLNRTPGYNARALIEASDRGDIDTLLCLGGNLYAANPDLLQARRALGKINQIFYIATKPNLGHFHGLAQGDTYILPVFNRFETPHRTTTESGNNFVRLNEPGYPNLIPRTDLVSEVELITEIAHRCLGTTPIHWRNLQDTRYIRELIADTIPGYRKIRECDDPASDRNATHRTGPEFTIDGRIFTTPKFATPNGKAQMHPTPLPTLITPTLADFGRTPDQGGLPLILGTGRSYGQHNTVVYQPGDKYRHMPHRYCILLNPRDIERGGFQPHQRVTVQGDAAQLDQIEIISGAIREGVAFMFYPEANVLFRATLDPKSGTPAYKRVPICVYQQS
jgi:molybdopterin-dependent oxidoreductase alpha subunit